VIGYFKHDHTHRHRH